MGVIVVDVVDVVDFESSLVYWLWAGRGELTVLSNVCGSAPGGPSDRRLSLLVLASKRYAVRYCTNATVR